MQIIYLTCFLNNYSPYLNFLAAKSLQLCPTLCDPIDGSPPGSPVPGILQARTLEWVAISFSNAGKWKVKVKLLSHVWLLATPWTAAYQAPPSMGFSRQEYWSGVPLPSPKFLSYCHANNYWALLKIIDNVSCYRNVSHIISIVSLILVMKIWDVLLLCWCHNKTPHGRWLKQQKCILSQLWKLEVQNQGASRASMQPVFLF